MRFKVENWTVIKGERRHSIQLLHTFSNNRIGIFLNDVMMIREDIGPNGQGQFSILVDGEPYRITAVMVNGQYRYTLEILEDQSRAARSRRKDEFRKGILFISVLFVGLAVAVIPPLLRQYKVYKTKMELAQHGDSTPGTITSIKAASEDGDFTIHYEFMCKGELIRSEHIVKEALEGIPISSAGFPVTVGDQLGVRYLGYKPLTNELHFDFPTPQQAQKYKDLASRKCWEAIPPEKMNPRYKVYCGCLSYFAYQHYGLKGLAELVHQETDRNVYGKFNAETYQRFMKKEDMSKAEKQCMNIAAEGNK